jgi:hypothetical protein
MKQAEIKKDTDYIIGPSSRLFDGVEWREEAIAPYRMSRVRVIDTRLHKQSTWRSSTNEPTLLEDGEKPSRSYWKVGALARTVGDKDGKLIGDPFVVKPQDVRMEFDAWQKEWTRKHVASKEAKAAALERRVAQEKERKRAENERARRYAKINDVLADSPIRAKILDGEVVLSAETFDELLAAANKIATKHLHVRKDADGTDKVFSHTDRKTFERDRRDFVLAGFDVEEV